MHITICVTIDGLSVDDILFIMRQRKRRKLTVAKMRTPAREPKGAATRRSHNIQQKGRKSAAKKSPTLPSILAVSDPTQANLDKFNHIVVLMLENRSFDRMLGYLSLTGILRVSVSKVGRKWVKIAA